MLKALRSYFGFKSPYTGPVLAALIAVFFGAFLGGYAYGTWNDEPSYRPWPDGVVTYYDSSAWPTTVQAAVDKWNATGIVRLRRVNNRKDAGLVISSGKRELSQACVTKDCLAVTELPGYHRRRPSLIRLPSLAGIDNPAQPKATMVVAHEIGHVVGLRHRHGCSVMTPRVEYNCAAKVRSARHFTCGPTANDLEDLELLYGKPARPGYSPYCPNTTGGGADVDLSDLSKVVPLMQTLPDPNRPVRPRATPTATKVQSLRRLDRLR